MKVTDNVVNQWIQDNQQIKEDILPQEIELLLSRYKAEFDVADEAPRYEYTLLHKCDMDNVYHIEQEHMSRKEFEKFRRDNDLSFQFAGVVSFRESDGDYAVLEHQIEKPTTYGLYNSFVQDYLDVLGLEGQDREDFLQFIDDYVCPEWLNGTGFNQPDYRDIKTLVEDIPDYILKRFVKGYSSAN